jgi:glycosyltransferase involved in cell wall biosynthesis
VAILSRKGGEVLPEDQLLESVTVFQRLPDFPVPFLREVFHLFFSWLVVLRTINEFMPDVVHIHNTPPMVGFVTSVVCSFKKIPVIYDIHDIVYELISSLEINAILKRLYLTVGLFLEKVSLSASSGIVTTSEAMKTSVLERVGRYIGNKPFVVMRNINPELVAFFHARDEESRDNRYILYSGVLYTETIGIEDLIEIMPRIYERYGVRFLIVGDGRLRKGLEERTRAKGRGRVVEFLGHVSRHRLYELTRGALLCVVPFRETIHLKTVLPHKLFEYMAVGKAVVFSDLPGMKELLGEENKGMFKPGNKEDMMRVIEGLLSDEGLRMSVCERNRERIRGITFEKELSSLMGLYEKIMSERRCN